MTSSLADLATHIVEQHHSYAKRELPRLLALAEKVQTEHGHVHPELHKIQELVDAMNSEICIHMLKEEQVLFPWLKIVEEAVDRGVAPPATFFGRLINPIHQMLSDHDETGELLNSIRNLTHDYKVPEDACRSYQALYECLSSLERDLHQHIHLENNILFPRALDLEKGFVKAHRIAANVPEMTGAPQDTAPRLSPGCPLARKEREL